MATRDDLCDWVVDALKAHNGRARIVDICKYICGKRGRSWDYAFLRIRSTIRGFLLTISSPIKRDFKTVG